MQRLERLFSSIKVGGVELRNRIILPSMETALTGEEGTMSERAIRFYEARARGGAAMIIPSSTLYSASLNMNLMMSPVRTVPSTIRQEMMVPRKAS